MSSRVESDPASSMEGCKRSALVRKDVAVAHVSTWSVLVEKEGHSVPRQDIFDAYLQECKAHQLETTNQAAFGKLFKRVFPSAGARRLGQRRQNKMHYRNIEWRDRVDPEELSAIEAARSKREERSRRLATAQQAERLVWVREDDRDNQQEEATAATELGPTEAVFAAAVGVARWTVDVIVAFSPFVSVGTHSVDDDHDVDTKRARSDQDEETGERPNSSSTSSVSVKLERRHTDEVEVEFEIRQASERKRRRNERHRESEDEEGFTVLSRECDSRRVLRSPADYYRMVTRDAWAPGAHMTLVQVAGECSALYRRELWNIAPINPLCLEDTSLSWLLTTTEGSQDVSAHALSSYIMLTQSSFICGYIDASREFFHRAYLQLEALSVEPDYDIAAALLPLSWWCRFYSANEAEGHQKEVYCVTVGAKICESVGAINDATYSGLINMQALHEMKNITKWLAETKKRPPFQKEWKTSRIPRQSTGELHQRMCHIYGILLQQFSFCMGREGTAEERKESARILECDLLPQAQDLLRALHRYRHSQDEAPAIQTHHLIRAYVLGIRTLIYVCLQSPKQNDSAKELVLHLVSTNSPIMVIAMHELCSNNFVIFKSTINILARCREVRLLQLFRDKLVPYATQFYWVGTIHAFVVDAIMFNISSSSWPSAFPPHPAPPPTTLPPAYPQP
ncbi:RFX DNAbinding domain containing protein [Acanthamoeba castellanii str. Neff]|uniref:RFX DNAbinding domain containing protein n=1 Tax=Acanthamoeba castellanii (strain ATCC 30010 / Neff) TaxID=1257118 RepID=L8GZ40_ACACF|nr:RFX DNAbinding domain containing protein [Acanthamoeba castellanii str. Neff]ELR18260.1 RFX DNAbinding domain containing protein [Acanthamoeba castellanii str. Neff]